MHTLDTIFTRRSIRAFTDEAMPEETLDTLIRAAAAAPTASNAQPWAFMAVRDPRRVEALRALSPGIIGRPPAVVVMCLDRRRRQLTSEGTFDEMAWIDLGLADAVRPLLGFNVYPAEAANLNKSTTKGKIEVSKVTEAHLAEAKIVDDKPSDPMVPGDKIHSPGWQPGRR